MLLCTQVFWHIPNTSTMEKAPRATKLKVRVEPISEMTVPKQGSRGEAVWKIYRIPENKTKMISLMCQVYVQTQLKHMSAHVFCWTHLIWVEVKLVIHMFFAQLLCSLVLFQSTCPNQRHVAVSAGFSSVLLYLLTSLSHYFQSWHGYCHGHCMCRRALSFEFSTQAAVLWTLWWTDWAHFMLQSQSKWLEGQMAKNRNWWCIQLDLSLQRLWHFSW